MMQWSCAPKQEVLLSFSQVIATKEPPEAEPISILYQKHGFLLKVLAKLAHEEEVDPELMNEIIRHMRAGDYYVCKAWVAMVEGNVELRNQATDLAELHLGRAEDKLRIAVKATLTGSKI